MLILFRQGNRTRASTRSIAWAAETVRNEADPVAPCGCIIWVATSGTEESLESSPRSFGCDRNLCPGRPDRLAPSDKEGS